MINFMNRPARCLRIMVGQFQPSRYFSGETVSPFFGISYAINEKYLVKFEYDTTLTPGQVGYKNQKMIYSFGIDFSI